MLLNVSYKDRKKKAKIDKEVGTPFPLMQRYKLGGIGSGKLFINSSSIQIHNLLVLDSYLNTCSVEIRPDGIIVNFRSILETYALVIPYYKLKLYKGRAEEYSIYRDNYFIKIKADNKRIHAFMKKISGQKADYWSSQSK
jgi:hypothetical protein